MATESVKLALYVFFLHLLLFLNDTNGEILDNLSDDTDDLQCDMSETSLNRYWTKNNLLRPDGCINRTNISILYMDGGEVANQFMNILRDGARRICLDYNIHCPQQLYGDVTIASVLPQIATDIAGSTQHGWADIAGVSLPSSTFTGLNDLHNEGVITATFLDEMYDTSNNPIGASLQVTQNDYLAGYNSCKKMIKDYGVTNILAIVPVDGAAHNVRRLACLDAMIDAGLSNTSYSWMDVTRADIEYDIELVSDELLNNTNINGIFTTSIKAHNPAFYALDRAINGDGSLSAYGLTKDRANSIKCLSQIDFSPVTIEGFRTNITKYASSQQPYIATSFTVLYLAIYASTNNKILFNNTLLSGPHFIESYDEGLLLECTSNTVRLCHDEEPDNPFSNCSCINTQNKNKNIYLFHYGGNIDSDYYTYFKILENAAVNAANDHNITLNIITSDNIDSFTNIVTSTVNNMNKSNGVTNGIISPLPNIEIHDLFRDNYLNSKNNILTGIANGYEYYKSLDIEQGNFFGSDGILSGYEMSRLLHLNYSTNNNKLKSIICIDNQNGLYSAINDRCLGVKNYCNVNNLTYKLIDNINTDSISDLQSPIGLISPGHSTCYEIQQFVKTETLNNSTNIYITGCFDSTSKYAINGLIKENVKIIIDNQPWLIGYLSVISLFNKLFLSRNLASHLIETGPHILTVFDNNDIKIKKCEIINHGFDFCPEQPLPSSLIDINYPTTSNFSGIFILLLFVISTIIVILICVAMYKYRAQKIIKVSQPIILLFTIIGGIIMMSSGLAFLGNNNNELLNNSLCNIPWSIWSIGFTIFFVSYTLRVWKYVKAIECGLNLTQTSITRRGMVIRLWLIVIIDIILVILSSIYTPIQSVIHYEVYSQDNDRLNDIITSQCELINVYLWQITFVYKLVILVWVLMVAFRKQASKNKIEKLNFISLLPEGPNITIGIYIVVVSFLLYFIIAVSLNTKFDESIKWVLLTLLSFICFITVLYCVIISKLIKIFKQIRLQNIATKLQSHASSSDSNANTTNTTNTNNDIELATSIDFNSNDDSYFDEYLQKCEYLIDETMELVQSSSFTTNAATAILPKATNLQKEIRSKSMSSKQNTTNVELTSTSQNKENKADQTKQNDADNDEDNDAEEEQNNV